MTRHFLQVENIPRKIFRFICCKNSAASVTQALKEIDLQTVASKKKRTKGSATSENFK